MADLTGTTIGQYRLISPLGQGGMATVYRGYQAGMERYVAVKVITPDQGIDSNFVQRFRHEARVISSLEHPNILPVYDYGEAQGLTYLVMRLVGSGTLGDQMSGRPLPLDRVQRIMAQVADALDYAHSRGVIHRDIKPSNILLDERGHALLSDFGIAKLAQNLTQQFTVAGNFVGTPYYASPEQAMGKELDGRSDLYSLGVILYEMATGRQPYMADTPMGVLFKHIQEPLPAPRSLNPSLSPAVEAVIVRALAKNKADRFPTGAALAAALNSALTPTAASGRTVLEPAPDPSLAARTMLDHAPTPPTGQPVATAYGATPPAYPTPYPNTAAPVARPQRRLPVWVWLGGGCGLLVLLLAFGVVAALIAPTLLSNAALFPPNTNATVTATLAAPPDATATGAATSTATEAGPTSVPPVGSDNIFVEYILDASGSMLEPMDGTNRWEIARRVLAERAEALPPDVHAGLRVYGHRRPADPADVSCNDIELIVPVAQRSAPAILAALPPLQARGMTPMSESLRMAAEDFTYTPENRNSIVLISDGIETCGADPATMAARLQEVGIDFTIHVIGLDVDAATREQLSRLAETGHGIYHDATSEADLRAALEDIEREALAPPAAGAEPTATPSDSPTPTSTPASDVAAPGDPTVTPSRTLAPLFTATPTLTLTPEPTPTRVPGVATDITFEGFVSSSSDFPGFFSTDAVDGDITTSWFSAGEVADGDTSFYAWTGSQEDFIAAITLIGNAANFDPANRTGFGFDSVTIQVYDALDQLVFEEKRSLGGTPDPDVTVKPGVVGQTVQLIFFGHESPDCGGFAELQVVAER